MNIRKLLSGGDRRSSAKSKEVLEVVRANPEHVPELVSLTDDEEWLVSMRAIDLLEKLAHEHTDWVTPHKHVFIGPLADSDKWEVRLQIVRALLYSSGHGNSETGSWKSCSVTSSILRPS
jgi:HEAT repeat protein